MLSGQGKDGFAYGGIHSTDHWCSTMANKATNCIELYSIMCLELFQVMLLSSNN